MKTYTPSLVSLGDRLVAILGLLLMTVVVYPETLVAAKLAQAEEQAGGLVFEIDSNKKHLALENQYSITYSDLVSNDPLVKEIVAYIKKKAPKSPLANPETVAHIIGHTGKTHTQEVWMRALAISFVESHMCTYTPKKGGVESHNCSGIMAGKGYKMYDSYEAWFTDMTKLLQKPSYVNRPLKSYLKFYVQPGSPRWYNGVVKVEADLATIKAKADNNQIALASAEVELMK